MTNTKTVPLDNGILFHFHLENLQTLSASISLMVGIDFRMKKRRTYDRSMTDDGPQQILFFTFTFSIVRIS